VTMADGHPHEHDLLAYVEDELARDKRDVVRMHLDSCAACRAQVADAEAGRALVRAAPPLELDPRRRGTILAGLGTAQPQRRRRPSWRLVMVAAAAILAAAALAFAASTLDGGQDQSGQDLGAALDSGGQREDGAAAPSIPGATLLREVAGTPASVAQDLQAEGFDAVVENDAVVVQIDAARRVELERTVAGFDPGPVAIYVR
jgi:predicted anti-sigma-YlaC factor YlaD